MDNGMGIFGIIALLAIANGGIFGNHNGYGNELAGTLAGNDALISNALQTTQLEAAANQRQTCSEFANTNSNIVNGNYQTQNAVNAGFANNARDLCTLGTSLAATVNNNGNEIKDRVAGVGQLIDNLRFELSQSFNCGIQSVKDMFRDYQEQNLRDANMRQYIESQLCGVVRYPNQWSYNAGESPFCNCGRYCNR